MGSVKKRIVFRKVIHNLEARPYKSLLSTRVLALEHGVQKRTFMLPFQTTQGSPEAWLSGPLDEKKPSEEGQQPSSPRRHDQ